MSLARATEAWKRRAGQLKVETYALYLAYKDPECPGMPRSLPPAWSAMPLAP